jgi:hypothetical protein
MVSLKWGLLIMNDIVIYSKFEKKIVCEEVSFFTYPSKTVKVWGKKWAIVFKCEISVYFKCFDFDFFNFVQSCGTFISF